MFTTAHFIWLAIEAACIVLGLFLVKKFKLKPETVLNTVLILVIISETIKTSQSLIESPTGGMFIKPSQLPLDLCSMQVIFILVMKLCKNEKVRSVLKCFMVPTMMIGAGMALLIPVEGCDPTRLRVIQYMMIHTVFVFYGIYLMTVEKVDLSFKAYKRNLLMLSLVAYFAFLMNGAMNVYDTNYFFLRKPPMDGLPVINLDNGYGVYLITLVTIALLAVTLVHLPFIIKEMKNRKSDESEPKEEIKEEAEIK